MNSNLGHDDEEKHMHAKLGVLKEISNLMNERLGHKISGLKEGSAKEESMESPSQEAAEENPHSHQPMEAKHNPSEHPSSEVSHQHSPVRLAHTEESNPMDENDEKNLHDYYSKIKG